MNPMPPAKPETIRAAMAVVEAKLQRSVSPQNDKDLRRRLDKMRHALKESIVYYGRPPAWLPAH